MGVMDLAEMVHSGKGCCHSGDMIITGNVLFKETVLDNEENMALCVLFDIKGNTPSMKRPPENKKK